MKKNILKATLVVAFALIAGMNVYNAQQSDIMSDLVLANVEALARNEISNCEMAVGIMEVGVCVEFGILDGKKHND